MGTEQNVVSHALLGYGHQILGAQVGFESIIQLLVGRYGVVAGNTVGSCGHGESGQGTYSANARLRQSTQVNDGRDGTVYG